MRQRVPDKRGNSRARSRQTGFVTSKAGDSQDRGQNRRKLLAPAVTIHERLSETSGSEPLVQGGRLETNAKTKKRGTNLENNGATAGLEAEAATGQHILNASGALPGDEEIEKKLELQMQSLRSAIDSPKTLLIVRNAALTLFEVDGEVTQQAIFLLVTDKDYRKGIVDSLISETPNYWDDSWNAAWTKEIEPLYSNRQQRIARRRSLISFWTKEWDSLPEDQTKLVGEALGALT
jgi:hypothetical protein